MNWKGLESENRQRTYGEVVKQLKGISRIASQMKTQYLNDKKM